MYMRVVYMAIGWGWSYIHILNFSLAQTEREQHTENMRLRAIAKVHRILVERTKFFIFFIAGGGESSQKHTVEFNWSFVYTLVWELQLKPEVRNFDRFKGWWGFRRTQFLLVSLGFCKLLRWILGDWKMYNWHPISAKWAWQVAVNPTLSALVSIHYFPRPSQYRPIFP